MITFLNFAPLSFMGGAEKWMTFVSNQLGRHEKVSVVSVSPYIADLYARVALGRSFKSRADAHLSPAVEHTQLSLKHFLPFTQSYTLTTQILRTSRVIYAKFEINEVAILLYFGGRSVLQKTIFGLHSPLIYGHKNKTLLQKLHNWLYQQSFIKEVLRQAKAVHVLASHQHEMLQTVFRLSHATYIPNFIMQKPPYSEGYKDGTLHVIFIGELSKRKGADILLQLINEKPKDIIFTICGDGPLHTAFAEAAGPAVRFLGHSSSQVVQNELANADVLFMPSEAEGLSFAMLEAISNGLCIITSPYIDTPELNKYVLRPSHGNIQSYRKILLDCQRQKLTGALQKQRKSHWKSANETFSVDTALDALKKMLRT